MIVTGDLTPPGATGEYSVGAGYFNGRPFWYRFSMGGTYMIWWNPGGDWVLSKLGDTTNYWYKKDSPDTVQGDYMASAAATGVATVVQGGLP